MKSEVKDLGLRTERMTINMGPQHPATHGVLRIVLTLDGERVVAATPHVGYLHRGIEKIAENKTLHQVIPYTDRMDYLSPASNNIGLCLAVEKLIGLGITEKCRVMRVVACELARISSHLLWLATDALDIGAGTIYFYAFTEREKYYDMFEKMTGARFTLSYGRIGGLSCEWESGLEKEVLDLVEGTPACLDEIEKLLTRNRIWIERNQDVGVISGEEAVALGLSGPNLRASGVEWDIRKAYPYLGYERYKFEIPVGEHGDCYDRYLVRLEEMRQSIGIVRQALKEYDEKIPLFPQDDASAKYYYPPKEKVLTSMEELIHQFIVATESPKTPKHEEIYLAIEAPKGELGFHIVGSGTSVAHRLHFRSPSFVNLQGLPVMIKGDMLADVIATVASLDPVLGEVDR
ncbi:MAG TPA: NADH dehydrogenase (quinone) subunit D [Acidobacteriota bacterium]|jgi:NADH-quinone oxidoreductase subunit D|nr:NADH dehydrogenase (quinone) subunit D [Acidobacteriota bacterium]HNT16504.1 NADH dehydrogenase (quinone) subunit D [Acidobacteriota bacterium]HPA26016.1 NADH dehydrogenase (quinone) subunit D [Acidobacteriota bacterium]HQO18979.1 NADH dehydrogenase (quinone) subunit D [Acidobacteriota bacterium]HQQ45872.1 NADH dehydrogenase (quinone) subunit D [Acidobacteriota bacterium]